MKSEKVKSAAACATADFWQVCTCSMLGIMKTGCALMKSLAVLVNEDGSFAA